MTVLSPQPLITLSYYSDQRVAAMVYSPVSPPAEDESASEPQEEPSSHAEAGPLAQDQRQTNPSLLYPPPPTSRRRPKRTRSLSSERPEGQRRRSGDEEESDDTSDFSDSAEPAVLSYTHSFRPFSYPSSANVANLLASTKGTLTRPDPPLCRCQMSLLIKVLINCTVRPKTFWRHTRRSAVTAPSYSPSSYLIRRSTFIAAGLSLDKPHADLSALSVELRVGSLTLVPSTALVV